MKKILLFGLFFSLIIALDQLIKSWVIKDSNYFCNTGIAWGFKFPGVVFYPLWFTIIIILIYYFFQSTAFFSKLGLISILVGAIFNIIDRLLHGCVIDYIQIFSWYPAFNLADTMIVIGGIIILSKSTSWRTKS